MRSADLHPQEAERLAVLRRYEVLDTEDEAVFDELTTLASEICGTPISLISLIDKHRQWFKSKVGLEAHETDRSLAFCSHAILDEKVFEVADATQDERFSDNPLVTSAPDIRFYAGAPLMSPGGLPLGTLCVIDTKPQKLTENQRRALQILAKQVISQLELRLQNKKQERLNKIQSRIFSVIAHDLRSAFSGVLGVTKIFSEKGQQLSAERFKKLSVGAMVSAQEVFQLLEELLQWSRQQWSSGKGVQEVFALLELVNECHVFFRDQLEHKNLGLDIQIDPNVTLNTDRALVKTVIRNVLGNASKFAAKDSAINIFCKTEPGKVHIAVENKGQEIDPALKGKLFRERILGESANAFEKGQGVGLLLCHDFLQTIGGTIRVDDEFSGGARIWVSLPLA